MCNCHMSMSLRVTPVSAASTNSTACALGSMLSVSSGSLPRALRPGVSRIARPCCSKGWGILLWACCFFGMSTWVGGALLFWLCLCFLELFFEFGDACVFEARLNRQQADVGLVALLIVEQLGGAHGGAAGVGGQEAALVVGEEDRVDELGLAARKLGDEGNDQTVSTQAVQAVVDA